MPIFLHASTARSTFGEPPLVEIAIATSPSRPSADAEPSDAEHAARERDARHAVLGGYDRAGRGARRARLEAAVVEADRLAAAARPRAGLRVGAPDEVVDGPRGLLPVDRHVL